jgi:tRNA(Ile)-lysidine synthase
MDLIEYVAGYINQHNLFSPGEKVVVGVSGGADSTCLLHVLQSLGYEVVIGHLDHQLRPESSEEAQYVKHLGQTLGVETILGKEDVKQLKENGFSLEEAARIARYRFLGKVAQDKGIMKLAAGHTADDQIETILMHFLRGAGISGLRGMLASTKLASWAHFELSQDLILVRPLLDVRRSQTVQYCEDTGLKVVHDPSNQDVTFFRNRIRHELIPYLKEFNPGIEDVILRMAKVLAGEAGYLESVLDEKWALLIQDENEGSLKFDSAEFRKLHISLRRSFIRRAIKELVPDARDLGFEHVERALEFLDQQVTSGVGQLPLGLELVCLGDEVVMRKVGERIHLPQYPQLETAKSARIEFPLTLTLRDGWSLIGEVMQVDEFSRSDVINSLGNTTAAMDVRSIVGSMCLRSYQAGERFQPLGMDGTIKVSDYFINRKIPHLARGGWPILYDRDGIVWIVGISIANRVKIVEDTLELYLIEVKPPKE